MHTQNNQMLFQSLSMILGVAIGIFAGAAIGTPIGAALGSPGDGVGLGLIFGCALALIVRHVLATRQAGNHK